MRGKSHNIISLSIAQSLLTLFVYSLPLKFWHAMKKSQDRLTDDSSVIADLNRLKPPPQILACKEKLPHRLTVNNRAIADPNHLKPLPQILACEEKKKQSHRPTVNSSVFADLKSPGAFP